MSRPEGYGEAPIANGGRSPEKHYPSAAAVVLKLQPRSADTNTLTVYGELHRLLGTTQSRQLLGPEAVATLSSLNYLILHHRNVGPSLLCDGEGESGYGCDGAKLALGHRCWDICGIGRWVSFRPNISGATTPTSKPCAVQIQYLDKI